MMFNRSWDALLILFLGLFTIFHGIHGRHRSDKIKKIGMYTPYNIIPGGGERYFLTSTYAYQKMGYHVDILIDVNNTCQSKEFLKQTAEALRIQLDYDRIKLVTVVQNVNELMMDRERPYELFYALGNSKIPEVKGLSKKANIYMCQFPFDMFLPPWSKQKLLIQLESLTTYDVVIVNSVYTNSWYGRLIQPYLYELLESKQRLPSVDIVYPPVDRFPKDVKEDKLRKNNFEEEVHIVLLGRFFTGRQSKGHPLALEILEQVVAKTDKKVHLTFVGAIHPEPIHYAYVEELQFNVTRKKLPVTFVTNAKPEQISAILSRAIIQWHLTGIAEDKITGDPASLEHFGIAVVEGMSSGCIPVVLNRGGTVDIVQHGKNGFLSDSVEDYVKHTTDLIKSSSARIIQLRDAVLLRSSEFLVDKFVSRISELSHKTMLNNVFRVFQDKYMRRLREKSPKKVAVSSNYTAVIVEPLINADAEFAIRNVMFHLGSDWALQVYYSRVNKAFMKTILRDMENVQFVPLVAYVRDTEEYNKLLKSPEFWNSIDSEKILIFQSDSIMLNSNIDLFLKYDYIGAPWNKENNEPVKKLIAEGKLNGVVGNGGFSLRTKSVMLKVIQTYGHTEPPELQEDLFFSRYVSQMGFNMPIPWTAYKFCREVQLSNDATGNEVEHLALHAAWFYMSESEAESFFERDFLLIKGKKQPKLKSKKFRRQGSKKELFELGI